MYRSVYFLIIGLLLSTVCYGQSDYFIVDNITYIGNKKTAQRVIDNELDILPGDTIHTSTLSTILSTNEKRLLSTGLFTLVDIEVSNMRVSTQKTDLTITVQENWYIYPSFIFELADRNFSVWWNEQGRDFSRVNYGLSLDHINLTGNRDKLKIKLQQGFTHKYELKYQFPYISKRWGASGEIFYSTNKEIGYTTESNKTLFRRAVDERVLLRRFRTGVGANYRPNVYTFHEAKLEFHHNSIDDLVAIDYNPDYFLNGFTDLRFFLLKYNFSYDRRLFTLYPEGGYALGAQLVKEGVGVFGDFNNLSLSASYEQHFKLNDRLLFGSKVKAKTNVIRNQVAFANNTGLGYGDDYIRGYELYVMDGTDWVYLKTNLRFRLFQKLYNLQRAMPLQQLKKLPFRLFARVHLESGYVHEPTYITTNILNNRAVIGYGVALDFLFWNTALMSVEYNRNDQGEGLIVLFSSFNF